MDVGGKAQRLLGLPLSHLRIGFDSLFGCRLKNMLLVVVGDVAIGNGGLLTR